MVGASASLHAFLCKSFFKPACIFIRGCVENVALSVGGISSGHSPLAIATGALFMSQAVTTLLKIGNEICTISKTMPTINLSLMNSCVTFKLLHPANLTHLKHNTADRDTVVFSLSVLALMVVIICDYKLTFPLKQGYHKATNTTKVKALGSNFLLFQHTDTSSYQNIIADTFLRGIGDRQGPSAYLGHILGFWFIFLEDQSTLAKTHLRVINHT